MDGALARGHASGRAEAVHTTPFYEDRKRSNGETPPDTFVDTFALGHKRSLEDASGRGLPAP